MGQLFNLLEGLATSYGAPVQEKSRDRMGSTEITTRNFLKLFNSGQKCAENARYEEATVYLQGAMDELSRWKNFKDVLDPFTKGCIQGLEESITEIMEKIRLYQQQLSALNSTIFNIQAAKYQNNPGEEWSPKDVLKHQPTQPVVPRKDNPGVHMGIGARQVPKVSRVYKPPVPKRAQLKQPGQQQPRSAGGARLKEGHAKQKHVQEKDPWESWEGQDKELAANLANDIMDSSPGIGWNDIAGLADAKQILQEAMVLPLLKPELFVGIRKPVKGVLLFGPPGTGKTLLAKALATECETTFFSVSSSTLASKWRGESERMVRVMFAMAHSKAPATIFIDEVDALCSSRGGGDNECSRRVKTEILVQINGIQSGGGRVMVMGATNFPWDLDEALRRRLEKRVYIPLPGHEERKTLLQINLREVAVAEDCDFDTLAQMSDGYSGDDLTNICRDAAMNGLRRAIHGKDLSQIKAMDDADVHEPVRMQDFMQAFHKVRPSVGKEDIKKHEHWKQEYGST